MAGRAAADRVLPDAVVERERLHVLGGLLLVLAVLEQARASGPEDGCPLTTLGLRQRAELELARIGPGRREAQRCVLVLDEVGRLLGGEGVLVGRVVHAGVGRTSGQDVRR